MKIKITYSNGQIADRALKFSVAALENIEESGIVPAEHVAQLRSGLHTESSLLELCLDGADEDREQGWRDYVDTVADAARDPA